MNPLSVYLTRIIVALFVFVICINYKFSLEFYIAYLLASFILLIRDTRKEDSSYKENKQ